MEYRLHSVYSTGLAKRLRMKFHHCVCPSGKRELPVLNLFLIFQTWGRDIFEFPTLVASRYRTMNFSAER